MKGSKFKSLRVKMSKRSSALENRENTQSIDLFDAATFRLFHKSAMKPETGFPSLTIYADDEQG